MCQGVLLNRVHTSGYMAGNAQVESPKWSTIFCCAQVGNALEELSGKEVKVGSDPTCSRILEALIPKIDHEHLLLLLTALSQGEEFCHLSSRCAVLMFMSMYVFMQSVAIIPVMGISNAASELPL
jgi:hypothetical protein